VEKRIIGGVKAKIPTYAGNYYVKVVKTTGEEDELNEYCGGVVVGHSWVLTHAWCVEDANHVHLLLGNFTFGAMRSKLRREKFETIIGGEDIYFSNSEDEDGVALLRVPFTMPKSWIKQLCSYESDLHKKEYFIGIIGTGATKEKSVMMPPFLKYMK
ncbi:uncharacterized protein LOC134856312, partial [Symsagittifera roscoffensis]|uniref:uncharacterized protein LOC134856312 n=1 Tax=Symsagittifera roscoffensis TaxID=84072 RepID=UPI00307C4817